MKIMFLQHEPFEGPGTILAWAAERKHAVGGTMIYKGEHLPSSRSFDMLVVMGGTMSVCDDERYPWFAPEKQLIRESVSEGKPVLGVCLGAQLIAAALGAPVRSNPVREIGWFPVTLTPQGIRSPLFRGWPLMFGAFHWHGDTFGIPAGGTRIAFSKACANQAFTCGSAVGLQFHLESTPDGVRNLIALCGDAAADGQLYVQSAEYSNRQDLHYPLMRELLFRLLDAMANPLEKGC